MFNDNPFGGSSFSTQPPTPYPPLQKQEEVKQEQPIVNNTSNNKLPIIIVLVIVLLVGGLIIYSLSNNRKLNNNSTTSTSKIEPSQLQTGKANGDSLGTKRAEFSIMAQQILAAVQTQYMYDSTLGNIKGNGIFIYDLEDLSVSAPGYTGGILVDGRKADGTQYIFFLHSKDYQLVNYNVTKRRMPQDDNIEIYNADYCDRTMYNKKLICDTYNSKNDSNDICYNAKGETVN